MLKTQRPHHLPERIVFFDGVCSLCNGFVDFLIRRDRRQKLHFASLQGKTWQEWPEKPEELSAANGPDTVIYYADAKFYTQSDAVLKIMLDIGWKWTAVFYLIPRFIRNACYRFIATIRYRVFGKRESCRVPLGREGERLLD